ncbi:MAG: Ig-like domain-containing protein [Ignavibacteriales bacterium]|nr:Ig-like domain-containing protein [Ignavibacteriales bacterium]
MKKNYILFLLTLILIAFVSGCETKTTENNDNNDTTDAVVLNGQVVAAETGNPLNGAIIKITDGTTVKGATTGTDGKFSASFELTSDAELTVIAFKAGYFQDTTSILGIVNTEMEVPIFQLQRDESSNVAGYSGKAASIYLYSQSAEFVGVTASGAPENIDIVFEVSDSSGIIIGETNSIEVSFRFGSAPNGGEYLYPSSVVTNALGKAAVSLKTGTKAGVAQIIAEAVVDGKPIASKPISVTIHGGFPDMNHFSIGPEKLNYPYYYRINDEAKVTVLIGDKYSNPVRPGTSVYFSSDAGVIQGSAQTNDMGVATASLLSGYPKPNDPTYGPGFFFVYASTVNENEEEITSRTRILFSGIPIVHLYPIDIDTLGNVSEVQTINIENGGIQSFRYTVTDDLGHPLASGNNYAVGVATEGDAGAAGDINITMPDTQEGATEFYFVVQDTKPDELKPASITVTVSVSGPNGRASTSAYGMTR